MLILLLLTKSAAATLTIPIGAATPGNPAYEPAYLTIKEDEDFDVINEDSSPNTVTSGKAPDDPNAAKMFDKGIILNQEDDELGTANLEPGEYDFHCAIYPFMTGKLKVVEE